MDGIEGNSCDCERIQQATRLQKLNLTSAHPRGAGLGKQGRMHRFQNEQRNAYGYGKYYLMLDSLLFCLFNWLLILFTVKASGPLLGWASAWAMLMRASSKTAESVEQDVPTPHFFFPTYRPMLL